MPPPPPPTHPPTDLPASLKPQLHNLYLSKTSPLRLSLARFSDTLGFIFTLSASWPTLYTTFLPQFHPHPERIIPTVTEYIIHLLDSLLAQLEEEDEEGGFQERFVAVCERWESVWRLGLWVRPCGGEGMGGGVRCRFVEERGAGGWRWVLEIPERWGEEDFVRERGKRVMGVEDLGDGLGAGTGKGKGIGGLLGMGMGRGIVKVEDGGGDDGMRGAADRREVVELSRKRASPDQSPFNWASGEYKLRKTETDEWSVIDAGGETSSIHDGRGGGGGGSNRRDGSTTAAAAAAGRDIREHIRSGSVATSYAEMNLDHDYEDDYNRHISQAENTQHTSSTSPYPAPPSEPLKPLPTLTSLPPPHQLFAPSSSLYHGDFQHILLLNYTSSALEIQCTHEPTLHLIHGYFTTHVEHNKTRTTLPPYVHVELLKTMWGVKGSVVEGLRFTKDKESWGARLDVAFVIAFVEGVCGYKLAEGNAGGAWVYRRRFPVESVEPVEPSEAEKGEKAEKAVEAGSEEAEGAVKDE